MIVAHSALWSGKSCAGDSAPQVAIRVPVAAGKMRAGEPKDSFDLRRELALREQVPGDPQIHDAPVGLRKARKNMPSFHTTSVDRDGFFGADGARLCGCRGNPEVRGRRPQWWCTLPDELQQRLGARRQAHTGMDEFHPGSVPARCASSRLLIGETGEPSQVTPIGAGQIATIGKRQQPASRSRHRRVQRRGAEVNPSLQMRNARTMAGAGLQHHTRVMSVGAHDLHDHRISTIQVDENIARVLVSGVGLDVYVASLAVADAQKPDGSRTHQLGRRPKSLSGKRTTCLVVNQTDQIQLVGHRRELATDGLPSQEKSTVVHDRNFAIEATRRTMNSQRTANSVLTFCLTSGDRFSSYNLL